MTGPIIFNHPVAREQFLCGEAFTFRAGEPRTTGETWARWSRTGPGMADARVERVTDAVNPRTDTDALAEYADRSGFHSAARWKRAMAETNRGLPNSGHVYRVTFLSPRPTLPGWLQEKGLLTACDGCGERVAPYVSSQGGGCSGDVHTRSGVQGIDHSWCAWDTVLPPDCRPDGWRFKLPSEGFTCAACGEEQTPDSVDVEESGAPEYAYRARCGSCGSILGGGDG